MYLGEKMRRIASTLNSVHGPGEVGGDGRGQKGPGSFK